MEKMIGLCKKCSKEKQENHRKHCNDCLLQSRKRQLSRRLTYGVTFEQRKKVISICGKHCLKCGSDKIVDIDHVIPIAIGGNADYSNLQPLCRKCNLSKHLATRDYRTAEQINKLAQIRNRPRVIVVPENVQLGYGCTFNLGSNDIGNRRLELYRKAATKEGLTLNAWVKKYLDMIAGMKSEDK